jgi:hypothetical protein
MYDTHSTHPTFKSRKINNDAPVTTRFKVDHNHQNIGSRIRSKMQSMCNSNVQSLFFPLYDAIQFQGHENFQKDERHIRIL